MLPIEESGIALGAQWPREQEKERRGEVVFDGAASAGYGQHQMKGGISNEW